MGKKADRRLRLFDTCAATAVAGGFDGFRCPLCGEAFERADAAEGKLLTIEHIHPGLVSNPRLSVLTCRKCNSTAGHKLDNHLHGSLALRGSGRPFDARITFGDAKEVNVEVTFEPGEQQPKLLIQGLPGSNHPAAQKKLLDSLESAVGRGTDQWGFSLQFALPPHQRVSVAYLRAAFLVAFAKLGYRFALSRACAPLREQIQNPDSKVVGFFLSVPGVDPLGTRRIGLMMEPMCMWVVQLGNLFVALPPFPEVDGFYEALGKLGNKVALRGYEFAWPNGIEALIDKGIVRVEPNS